MWIGAVGKPELWKLRFNRSLCWIALKALLHQTEDNSSYSHDVLPVCLGSSTTHIDCQEQSFTFVQELLELCVGSLDKTWLTHPCECLRCDLRYLQWIRLNDVSPALGWDYKSQILWWHTKEKAWRKFSVIWNTPEKCQLMALLVVSWCDKFDGAMCFTLLQRIEKVTKVDYVYKCQHIKSN